SLYFSFDPASSSVIYSLSLHDALPICLFLGLRRHFFSMFARKYCSVRTCLQPAVATNDVTPEKRRSISSEADGPYSSRFVNYARSEEHTSELQSQSNLVCRLLLEKKKK